MAQGSTTQVAGRARTARTLGILVVIAGVVLSVSGVVAYFAVRTNLSQERISVSSDAPFFADDPVDGPWTAYMEAEMINQHYLESTGGKTYAELGRDDPLRQTAMTASFLRASLFTSVVAFGVSVMAFGLGVVFILVGWAVLALAPTRRPAFE
jgi:hypothetical protein